MSNRKLPNCAHCGKSLIKDWPRVTLEFCGTPGAPLLGWHGRCGKVDPVYDLAMKEVAEEASPSSFPGSVYNIWKRGGDRVAVLNDGAFTRILDTLLAAEGDIYEREHPPL